MELLFYFVWVKCHKDQLKVQPLQCCSQQCRWSKTVFVLQAGTNSLRFKGKTRLRPECSCPVYRNVFVEVKRRRWKLDFIFVQTGYINLENCGASFRVYILYRGLFQQSVRWNVHDTHICQFSLRKKDCVTGLVEKKQKTSTTFMQL